MPPAVYRGDRGLRIELDNIGSAEQPCRPGDVITGRITRSVPGVSPRATVTLRLLGRAKTKITVTHSNGQSTTHSHYRNRYPFFDPTQTRQFLHDGPLHLPLGAHGGAPPLTWPFAVTMPLHPSPSAVRSENTSPDVAFLSLQPEAIAAAPLPASFAASGSQGNTYFETYVEYHLEAELLDSGSHGRAVTAVMPIYVRAPPLPPTPITDFAVQRRCLPGGISKYRLVPGLETAELSFKQKTRQLLGSSKVPMFSFVMQVDCPAILQLGHPAPIPFAMRIVPHRTRTSEVIRDVEQTVSLISLDIVVKACTETVAPTTFSKHYASDTVKHYISLPVGASRMMMNPSPSPPPPLLDDDGSAPGEEGSDEASSSPPAAVQPGQPPFGIVIPSGWDDGQASSPPPPLLDVGAAMDFRLFSTHATAFGQTIARTGTQGPISPAFTTYCIRHGAMLKWKAQIEVAGQIEKFEAQQAVTILGPSESLSPPPPLAVAQQSAESPERLPSYGENEGSGAPSGSAGAADVVVVQVEEELPIYAR